MPEIICKKHFIHPGCDGMFIEIVRCTKGSTPAESHVLLQSRFFTNMLILWIRAAAGSVVFFSDSRFGKTDLPEIPRYIFELFQ